MSSYLSNLLTTTTSRYNTLRRTLLSDETDGDTEDDTHISRVLRAYYTEKSRPFPPWLPPDPRAPQKAPPPTPFISGGRSGSGGRGLSDLWDNNNNNNPQQHAQEGPQPMLSSLRRGGQQQQQARTASAGGILRQGSDGGGRGVVDSYGRAGQQEFQRSGSLQSDLSRRTGSNDNGYAAPSPPPPPPLTTASSAQERLKARLLGGAGRSPSPGTRR